jgi:hypothetical protein
MQSQILLEELAVGLGEAKILEFKAVQDGFKLLKGKLGCLLSFCHDSS